MRSIILTLGPAVLVLTLASTTVFRGLSPLLGDKNSLSSSSSRVLIGRLGAEPEPVVRDKASVEKLREGRRRGGRSPYEVLRLNVFREGFKSGCEETDLNCLGGG